MISSMNVLLHIVGEHSSLSKLHVNGPCICLDLRSGDFAVKVTRQASIMNYL